MTLASHSATASLGILVSCAMSAPVAISVHPLRLAALIAAAMETLTAASPAHVILVTAVASCALTILQAMSASYVNWDTSEMPPTRTAVSVTVMILVQ
jgi:hypothetical protein